MLDDLRKSTFDDPIDDNPFDEIDATPARAEQRGFLGMSPIERMFLAIFFFMDVIVIGAVILLLSNRVAP